MKPELIILLLAAAPAGSMGRAISAQPWPPMVGEVDALGSGANEEPCWSSKTLVDQAAQAARANDTEGFRQLVFQHNPVLLIGAYHLEIRVLSGANEDTACWTQLPEKNDEFIVKRLSAS